MSFFLRPYRTVPGPDFEENRSDLELLVDMARIIRPQSDLDYMGRPGYRPYCPNDFFLDSSDAGYDAGLEQVVKPAGRRIAGQIARKLGWDRDVNKYAFEDIGWTLFHSDLNALAREHLDVGRLHADIPFFSAPRGLWLSKKNAAGLILVCPADREGVAYCTNHDDTTIIEAFAALPNNRIVVIRGNTVVEMTDDMIHGRENLWSTAIEPDPLQYAMRVTWPT